MKNNSENLLENQNKEQKVDPKKCEIIKTNILYYIPLLCLIGYMILSYLIFLNFIIIPQKKYDSIFNFSFHIFLFLSIICLIISLVKDPGIIKENFNLDYIKKLKYAYCYSCMIYKEDRVHHCKKCNVCVKQLDHHCYWLNKCIGKYNRKQFILFLFYSLISKILIFIYSYNKYAGLLWKTKTLMHYFLLVFFLIFTLMLGYMIYFTIFNLKLIFTGLTAVENYNRNMLLKSDNDNNCNSYYANFCSVFGANFLIWFIPINYIIEKEKIDNKNDNSSLSMKSRNKGDIINDQKELGSNINYSTNFSELINK